MKKKNNTAQVQRTLAKYRKIQARYGELYNTDRRRHDDCIRLLAEDFFMSASTISLILAKELPEQPKADS